VFELIQLRCFVAVADELHFGRAATRLNMTQPPLSRHIQVLERIVGLELLARTSRSVRLTAAGLVFLAEARRIVELTDSAVATARAAAEGQRGMVALGFTAASGYSFLPSFFGRMRIDMPDVKLLLKEMGHRGANRIRCRRAGWTSACFVRRCAGRNCPRCGC